MKLFAKPRIDLALHRDPAGRLVPWIIGIMVFLATLAGAGALGLQHASGAWKQLLIDSMTVQIADGPDADAKVTSALRLLTTTHGIASARQIPTPDVIKLLEPWIGNRASSSTLPLPRLIDVRIAPGADLDKRALARKLADIIPGVQVDDHRQWLDRLAQIIAGLQFLAVALILIVTSAMIAIVIFSVRAGLLAHREVIEVLHLVGAEDPYIARQFQIYASRLAFAGAWPGFIMAAGIAFLLGIAADQIQAPLLPNIALTPIGWTALIAAPILSIVLASVTARITVGLHLKHIL